MAGRQILHAGHCKIRNRGGNVPIVLESNQNHATAKETEICPSLPASMGLWGGYVPMIVEEVNAESNRNIEPRSASGKL